MLAFFLHGRELLHHVHDEVVGDLLQMLQNLDGALDEVGLVVLDAPLLAEGFDELVALGKVVAGHHGEEVVIDLVLESAAEPVDEELGEAVASGDVAGGGHLELPEVRPGGGVVGGHAVVAKAEDEGQEEAAGAGGGEEVGEGVGDGEPSKSGGEGDDPGPVHGDAGPLEEGVLESLALHLELGVLRGGAEAVGGLEGLVEPGEAGEEEDGEVGEGLPPDHELDEGAVLAVGAELAEGLGLLETPGEEGHGVDVGIAVLGDGGRVVEVGHGVVAVVLVLPPLHAVSLHEVAPEDADEVSVLALLEDLVVEEVVGEPSALLPEEAEEEGAADVHGEGVGAVDHGDGRGPHGHVEGALVGVVELGALEHAHHDELGPEVAVSLLEVELALVLVGDGLRDEVADVELLHHGLAALRVEGGEDVRHVVAGVGEDDGAAGMLVPVGHVVHLVLVDDPGILGGNVLLDLGPRVLLNLLRGGRGRNLATDLCVTTLAHCS